jgi:hypothetical protein
LKLGGERKAILEEVQGILEMVLSRVKLGKYGRGNGVEGDKYAAFF